VGRHASICAHHPNYALVLKIKLGSYENPFSESRKPSMEAVKQKVETKSKIVDAGQKYAEKEQA
jgi:hypothetical protein